MGTYSSIQTRVTRRLIDLPAAVLAEVPTLVNEALKTIQGDHNFKVMEAIISAQQTTVATRVLVAVPSNFKEYREDGPYYITNNGVLRRMSTVAQRNFLQGQVDDQEDGSPRYILQGVTSDTAGTYNFEVYPLPDGNSDFTNGEYRIYIPYWRYIPAMSADADTNWFTVNAEEYLVNKATGEGFGLDWDYEAMAIWLQKADLERKKVIKQDKMLALSGVETLVPHWRGVYEPKVRT